MTGLPIALQTFTVRDEAAQNFAAALRRVAHRGLLERLGAACKARGLPFSYHHDAFEFGRVEGTRGIDVLFDSADPALVGAELDRYWVQYAGCTPATYIRKLAGCVPLLHIKDMADGPSHTFAEIGEGVVDFKAIFDEAEPTGTEW